MHNETQSNGMNKTLDKLLISYKTMASNKKLACVSLNKPKALNALDSDMIRMFLAYLEQWRLDDDIVGVFIDSTSEKAFCAGGDIVALYRAISAEVASTSLASDGGHSAINQKNAETAAEFFAQEYRLDYCLHSYPKPVIAWGNGIIMGGGLGIFAGSHLRIVTEFSKVAMPEITIGLFPDVGASYFLNKMPKGVGKFLGLTATKMNAKDCITTNLASFFIPNQNKEQFLEKIAQLSIFSIPEIDKCCEGLIVELESSKQSVYIAGNLDSFKGDLGGLDEQTNIAQIETYIGALSKRYPSNKVMQKAYDTFLRGSPITANLIFEQMAKGVHLSLGDCFRMELNMAYGCCASGEFKEGIRALLIDKDNSPNWLYNCLSDVPQSLIDSHFNHYNNSEHPLAHLELTFGEHYA